MPEDTALLGRFWPRDLHLMAFAARSLRSRATLRYEDGRLVFTTLRLGSTQGMMRTKKRKRKYKVELLLGKTPTRMYLPKSTGNWFSYRISEGRTLLGTLDVGRGSIFWRPSNKWKGGPTARRWSWHKLKEMMR